jgi:hypothetical protein
MKGWQRSYHETVNRVTIEITGLLLFLFDPSEGGNVFFGQIDRWFIQNEGGMKGW